MNARLLLLINVLQGTRRVWLSSAASTRSERMNFSSSAFTAGCSSGLSRNHQYQNAAHRTPMAPNSTNGHRHPCLSTRWNTSGVEIAAPTALPTNAALNARPWCDEGNQRDMLLAMLGKAPASPAPNRNRTSSSDANPVAAPVSAV